MKPLIHDLPVNPLIYHLYHNTTLHQSQTVHQMADTVSISCETRSEKKHVCYVVLRYDTKKNIGKYHKTRSGKQIFII